MKNFIPVILLYIFLPLSRCQTLCSSPCLANLMYPNVCEGCNFGCYLNLTTHKCYKCSDGWNLLW